MATGKQPWICVHWLCSLSSAIEMNKTLYWPWNWYYKANIIFKKRSVVLEKGSLSYYSSLGSFMTVSACTHLPWTPGSSPFLRWKVFYSFCFLHFSSNWSTASTKSLDILFKLILIKITRIRIKLLDFWDHFHTYPALSFHTGYASSLWIRCQLFSSLDIFSRWFPNFCINTSPLPSLLL